MANTSTNWLDYEKTYSPIYDELTVKLKADQIGSLNLDDGEVRLVCIASLMLPLTPCNLIQDSLDVAKFIKSNGIDALVSKFSIKLFRSASKPNLVHISHDGSTPLGVNLTQVRRRQ